MKRNKYCLHETLTEVIKIQMRAEERYQEALFYLHRFKDIEKFRDTHTNEVIVIGHILGYSSRKITNDIHNAVLQENNENE